MDGLDTMLAGMDGTQPAAAPATDPAPAAPTVPPAATSTDPATPPAATPPEEEFNPDEMFNGASKGKQNYTFAKMRTENSRMSSTMQKLGQMLGIPNYTDENALLEGLNTKMLELQSTQSKVPLDFLQDAETTKQKLSVLERQQYSAQTELGFQKVKDEYKLSNTDLKAFATKLFEEGKNPYAQPMNLLNEYRVMFHDEIVKRATAAAVEEALKRDQKAANQSTKPGTVTGSAQGGGQGVQSMADLNALLDSLDKK